jgi:hypothetical protein
LDDFRSSIFGLNCDKYLFERDSAVIEGAEDKCYQAMVTGGLRVMVRDIQKPVATSKPSQREKTFEIELNQVPIVWDLESGNLSFFGIDSALFWTDPSLVYMLAPLAEEVGIELFRLTIAHSSSFGTKEDYHAMVSTLGGSFEEGFLAWGKAVSAAGWGTFKLPKYDPENQQATVIVNNPWEIGMQRNLSSEKRWGTPFLQGKIIGIFNHAFGNGCWADDICYYDSPDSRTELKIFPSKKTIKNELKKLRYERMMAGEKILADKVDQKTAELRKAKKEIELYSRTLELKVAERTSELVKANKQLQKEVEIRKEAEAKKEMLIIDLQKTIKEVKTLRGLLPICSSCKKVRDDKGYWSQIESFIQEHSDAEFSHSICPECAKKLYPDLYRPND